VWSERLELSYIYKLFFYAQTATEKTPLKSCVGTKKPKKITQTKGRKKNVVQCQHTFRINIPRGVRNFP